MTTVKTAISLDPALMDSVNALAEELNVSRSRLFVMAVEQFLQQHKNQRILSALNEVYQDVEPDEDAFYRQAMQNNYAQLLREESNESW